jgi:cytochrome P450
MALGLPAPMFQQISLANPEAISTATIDDLPYLNTFCNDILGFYPSVPRTVRRARHDITLVSKHILEGTILALNPGIIQSYERVLGSGR